MVIHTNVLTSSLFSYPMDVVTYFIVIGLMVKDFRISCSLLNGIQADGFGFTVVHDHFYNFNLCPDGQMQWRVDSSIDPS